MVLNKNGKGTRKLYINKKSEKDQREGRKGQDKIYSEVMLNFEIILCVLWKGDMWRGQ